MLGRSVKTIQFKILIFQVRKLRHSEVKLRHGVLSGQTGAGESLLTIIKQATASSITMKEVGLKGSLRLITGGALGGTIRIQGSEMKVVLETVAFTGRISAQPSSLCLNATSLSNVFFLSKEENSYILLVLYLKSVIARITLVCSLKENILLNETCVLSTPSII